MPTRKRRVNVIPDNLPAVTTPEEAEEARKTLAKKASTNTILTTDVSKPKDDPPQVYQGSSYWWGVLGLGIGIIVWYFLKDVEDFF